MSRKAKDPSDEQSPPSEPKHRFVPLSLFASSSPAQPAQDWDAVLRCHNCGGHFSVRKLPLKRIALVPQIAPCPHCAARASAAAKKLHRIVDLRLAKD
ncbi:MAG TPA: hypothetical protein VGH50_04930 [Candidatus Binatia bacterium]|jgi:hypothetical protein